LGIHKQSNKNKEENYTNFLGRVFDSLKNTVSSLENEVLHIDLMSNRVYGKIINNKVGRYYIGEIKYINNNPELNGPGVLYSKDRKKSMKEIFFRINMKAKELFIIKIIILKEILLMVNAMEKEYYFLEII